eukprot:CAMPEP_0198287020 /NCGR_PEP_ID=MMETSP1449-20131203/5958_1 /TAXON_ID=420275 /ORGANISM="Attheya septentrionalis, Strain CCMP2084" /LENGTH=347 /DNA_ID=CAMNT_0043984903 /DNA_START=187 /DNA_END=1230 /DNA_ORIENTATION=+
MGRADDLIPLEVAMHQSITIDGDTKDKDRCMKEHEDFMRNLQMEKERVDNEPPFQTDFQSSLRSSITFDDLGTIFETDDHKDSDVNGDDKSTNSPAASTKVCNDNFLQTMSDVNTNVQKTKVTPSMSPNVELNDNLGPSVEARRPPYRRRSSTSSSTISTYDIDSSQSSSSHLDVYKQPFAEARMTATLMRSSSSGDLLKYNDANKLSSNRRQTCRLSPSLPGSSTTNSFRDYADPFKSVVKPSPMIELLRKKSKKQKSAYAASQMIQEINEAEAMLVVIAKQEVADEHATNKEQEVQKKLKSNRMFRPVITIDEPDDDGGLSMGSDDLSVYVGRSTELDFSQSSIF